MNNKITIDDFEKICRICLRFDDQLQSITLFNITAMIQSCSSVQIDSEDDLPHNVCGICLSHLQAAFNFKHLCENSDRELREIIKEHNNNSVNENIKVENENCDVRYDVPYLDIKNDSIKVEDDVQAEFKEDDFEDRIPVKSEGDSDEKTESQKKYACEPCKLTFSKSWKLGTHMRRVHRVKGEKCSRCSLICYHRAHLEEHEKNVHETTLVCPVCKKEFVNRKRFSYHKLAHSAERPHQCPQCDVSFKFRFNLTQHIKTVHITHTFEVCRVCGKNVRQSYLAQHLKYHEERDLYACRECPKTFGLKTSLDVHIRRVHQNEPLKYSCLCNICGRRVACRAELQSHMRTHTGEKPYKCDKCDKSYGRSGALNQHIRSAHLDERPWVCTICSQAFHSKNILRGHMVTHTGERPYTCLICGKSFGFGSVLKTHMKIHAV